MPTRGHEGLSEYELERLATIQANNKFLSSLNLGPKLTDSTNKAQKKMRKKLPPRKAKPAPKTVRVLLARGSIN